MNIQVHPTSSNLASAMLNSKIRPRAVVGYGVKIFQPSPPNYVTRSPGSRFIVFIDAFSGFRSICVSKENAVPNYFVLDFSYSNLNFFLNFLPRLFKFIVGNTSSKTVALPCFLLGYRFLLFAKGYRRIAPGSPRMMLLTTFV